MGLYSGLECSSSFSNIVDITTTTKDLIHYVGLVFTGNMVLLMGEESSQGVRWLHVDFDVDSSKDSGHCL